MDDEKFSLLLTKIEAQRLAMASFVQALVQRLATDCGMNAELLLEHLHILQSNLPGLGDDAGKNESAIGKEVLKALGTLIGSVDQAIVALHEE